MNVKLLVIRTVLVLCGSYAALSNAAPDEELLKQCADCHGAQGNSEESKIPTIAGISAAYFKETMQAFAAGDRPAATIKREGKEDSDMGKVAKQLNAQQLEQLASYYAQQTFVRAAQPFDAELAQGGKRIHRKYCEKCHEDDGRSKEDDAGILAGQQEQYLRETLRQIRVGERPMGKKMQKKIEAVAEQEGDAGFEQLVHHYISQQ